MAYHAEKKKFIVSLIWATSRNCAAYVGELGWRVPQPHDRQGRLKTKNLSITVYVQRAGFTRRFPCRYHEVCDELDGFCGSPEIQGAQRRFLFRSHQPS